MSHQIDFRCHRTAREWNGHWGISDRAWRLMRGRRAYFLNRAPYAEHAACIRQTGFEIVSEHRVHDASGIGRARLTERFKNVSDEDLSTSGVFVQARKPLVPSSR